MGKLIKEESTARGVNFQKASCTLDASVKIYSHRVDDTYASSHRILESLSRNGGEDDNGNTERAAARVGTKSASNRLNIAETIERNAENLNSAKLESEHAADPMFHKMSKAFDEGGARGMLMNNLRVTPGTCSLVFTSEGLVQDAPAQPTQDSHMVDITDLVFKCGFAVEDLQGLGICPTLEEYRRTMGVAEDSTGCLAGEVVVQSVWGDVPLTGAPSSSSASSSAWASAPSSSGAGTSSAEGELNTGDAEPPAYAADDYDPDAYGADAYGGGDDDDDCDDEGNYIASNRRATMATGMAAGPAQRESLGPQGPAEAQTHKIRWGTLLPGEETAAAAPVQWEGLGAQGGAITSGNEYAFFDMEALMKSNSWAGARHWRFAAKKAAPAADKAVPEGTEELEAPEPGKKATKKATKKEAFVLSFAAPASEGLFAVNAKSRSDTTMQTTAAVDKASAAANELFLPVDSKLQARDLCRLFLCPPMLVPPAMLTHMLQPSAQAQGTTGDMIWGQVRPVPSSSGPLAYNNNYDDDDDDGGGYGYAGDDGDDDFDSRPPAAAEMEVPEGLALQGDRLLQATRVVEKLEIGYATVAKRVNVRKLKGDLWSHISTQVAPADKAAAEEDQIPCAKAGKKDTLSFQEVVNDLALGQQQSEVTLPFYFICLLHLANEKVTHPAFPIAPLPFLP